MDNSVGLVTYTIAKVNAESDLSNTTGLACWQVAEVEAAVSLR